MISLADLHCDTLYKCFTNRLNLTDMSLHINLQNIACFDRYIQTFAHYIPENTENKWQWFLEFLKYSQSLLHCSGVSVCKDADDLCQKRLAILSVEGGDLFSNIDEAQERIPYLKSQSILLFSMIYNHTNGFGCGALSKRDTGLSELGKSTIVLLEENKIIPDVSHASYRSTAEILDIARGPVCATHSNAYVLTKHPRNLRDEHLRRIADKGGLVGVNLYPVFLGKDKVDRTDIYRHIRYMLDVCGERAVCFGCDLDGVDCLPEGVRDLRSLEIIFSELKQFGFSEKLLENIFFNNIYEFFDTYFRR